MVPAAGCSVILSSGGRNFAWAALLARHQGGSVRCSYASRLCPEQRRCALQLPMCVCPVIIEPLLFLTSLSGVCTFVSSCICGWSEAVPIIGTAKAMSSTHADPGGPGAGLGGPGQAWTCKQPVFASAPLGHTSEASKYRTPRPEAKRAPSMSQKTAKKHLRPPKARMVEALGLYYT